MDLDSMVFVCSDVDLVAGYVAHAQLSSDLRNACVEEAARLWNRKPVGYSRDEREHITGISRRPIDWDWISRRKDWAAEQGLDPYHYSEERDPKLAPPPGWRKLVKDDYLTPPKKGSSPEILEARAFCKRWTHESLRGYLKRVAGIQPIHFAGMRLITIGCEVEEDKLWVIGGKGYEIKDERFQQVPLSEYVAMRERNPRQEVEDEDA